MARHTIALLVLVLGLGAATEVYSAEFRQAQNPTTKKILCAVLFRFSQRLEDRFLRTLGDLSRLRAVIYTAS
jgi:hypothetical protein